MKRKLTCGKALLELGERSVLKDSILITGLYIAYELVATLSYLFCIREHELHINNFYVFIGLNGLFDMKHVWVVEKTDHLKNRIRLANVCQKLIPQTFPRSSALYKSGDVNELYYCRNDFLTRGKFCE